MRKTPDHGQSPEDDAAEKIRAELRAAGLLRHIEPVSKAEAPAARRREAIVIPFRKPVPAKPPASAKRQWIARIFYIALVALIVAVTLYRR